MTALELWDLWADDRILWDCMGEANFGAALADALKRLQRGDGATRSEGPAPDCVRGFESVFVTGGGAFSVVESLQAGPWNLITDSWSSQAPHPGGETLLAKHCLAGWTLDLGQSALKIWGAGHSGRWDRDLARLPVRTGSMEQRTAEQREELRRFAGGALQAFAKETASMPQGLVFALPSRLDDMGMPEGSSYIGMRGDRSLVQDVLARADMTSTRALVLNDAELAAVAAQASGRTRGRTLVLTIGFGIGAALIS